MDKRRGRPEIVELLKANSERIAGFRALLNSIDTNPNANETIKSKFETYIRICDLSIRLSKELLGSYLTFTESQKRILIREINDIEDIKTRLKTVKSGLTSPAPNDKVSVDIRIQLRDNKEALEYIVEKLNAVEKDPSKLTAFKLKIETYIKTCLVTRRETEVFQKKLTATHGDRRAVKRELEDIDDLIADLKAQAKKELSADEEINPKTEEPTSPRQSNR